MHYFYNVLMEFYQNEKVVEQQKEDLERSGRTVVRDEYYRFVFER